MEKVKFLLACPECGRTSCHHDASKGSLSLVAILSVMLVGSLVVFSLI